MSQVTVSGFPLFVDSGSDVLLNPPTTQNMKVVVRFQASGTYTPPPIVGLDGVKSADYTEALDDDS